MNLHQLQRRQLLKRLGAAGLLASVPLAARATTRDSSPQLAVFLPRSHRYPALSAEYLAGLTLGLSQQGLDAERLLPIEYRADPAVAVRAAQALLGQEHLLAMTGVLCPTAAVSLEPTLLRAGVPLLVNDTGANRMAATAPSGIIMRQSLEYWQSCAAFGQWAPSKLGRRALLALGNLEFGYDFPTAFSHAYAASGGTLVATHISDLPQADSEFAGLATALQEHQPDFVFALYSGRQAQRFLAAYRALPAANKVPLVGGGFLGASAPAGMAAGPDLSVASWHAATSACARFAAACEAGNMQVTPFTVLGYESGDRIATAWRGAASGSEGFITALRTAAPTTGPRGPRLYNPASMESQGAHWVAQAGSEQSTLMWPAGADLHTSTQSFTQDAAGQQARGWINTYLVA